MIVYQRTTLFAAANFAVAIFSMKLINIRNTKQNSRPQSEVGSILYKGEGGLHITKERRAEVDDKRVISPLNRGFRHAPCRFSE